MKKLDRVQVEHVISKCYERVNGSPSNIRVMFTPDGDWPYGPWEVGRHDGYGGLVAIYHHEVAHENCRDIENTLKVLV